MTGDVLNRLLEAIRKDDRSRWIGVRHEEHAACAAAAQAELTGRIGVCAGTAGPGALHLINGLYNAQKEGAAVVAITGQVPRAERGSDFHKEMDLVRVFEDVCAYQEIIETPAQMPRMAEIAVQKPLLERVLTRIELPADVIGQDLTGEHFTHPLVYEVPQAWGFGISKITQGLMGLRGDHEVWTGWRDEFRASLG
jgi:pyruvate dehydrogenase (quinone)